MKAIFVLPLLIVLPSCTFLHREKIDNSTSIDNYEKKMKSIALHDSRNQPLDYDYKICKAGLSVVDPDDIFLFYKDDNKIVIKECEKYSVAERERERERAGVTVNPIPVQ